MSLLFIFTALILSFTSKAQHVIDIDFSQATDSLKNLMGVNKFNPEYTQGYVQTGISEVRLHDERESDYYNYSTFWNYDTLLDSFTHINNSFDPSNPMHYNWNDLDTTISTLANNGMDVYFRLGISWPDNNLYTRPPTRPPYDSNGISFNKFAALCKRTVMHYNNGWDNGFNYGIKHWEIWNEPDYTGGFFWDGSANRFYKLYETVSKSLKNHDSTLIVGASGLTPVTIILDRPDFYLNFLSYVQNNNLALDFLSWHLYGAQNPYGIKQWADKVRRNLDSMGFVHTQSHITELNFHLDQAQLMFGDNAAGATYLLSNLLTLQASPVDKLYWYPGNALIEADSAGTARLKWNAYGMKTYQLMYQNTPTVVQSSGAIVVENNWEADSSNLMVLAAKSINNDKLYLAISNFNSSVSNFQVRCSKLPFTASDQLKITQNIVKAPNDKFSQTIQFISGDSVLNIPLNNRPAPSISFLRIELDPNTSSQQTALHKPDVLVFPNPSKGIYHVDLGRELEQIEASVYHSSGQLIQKEKYAQSSLITIKVDAPAGNYWLELRSGGQKIALPIHKID